MKISKILKCFVLLSTILTACSEDSDKIPEIPTSKIVLTASKNQIFADGNDKTVFSVTQDDVDVTDEVTIYQNVDGEWIPYDGIDFVSSAEGTFEFQAKYNEQNSNIIQIKAVSNEIFFTASKSLIEADGKDTTFFSIIQAGIDITSKATIYQKENGKWTLYKKRYFASSEEGTYEFSADYNGLSSEPVMIQAAMGLGELPTDPNPAQFDAFRKRVLAMQFTGIGCGWCPVVINAIENFLPMPNAENAVFAALHSYSTADPMYSDDAWEVARNMNITGYPTMVYNMEHSSNVHYAPDGTIVIEDISGIVDTYMATAANSAISASVTQEGSATDGKLKVQGAVKIAADGAYLVSVWLLEDGIKYPQANYTDLTIGDIHNNAVRLCSTTNPVGAQFGGRNNWKAGETGVFFHEFDLKKSKVVNLENCHVVVYVTSSTKGIFTVDNVIDCKIGEVKSFEYTK